ncbi:hypothetical protein CL615_04385 [archaeon]|jgi:hypothetical protein|nr:hypothetical protein [archaeon]MDP6547657.1 hypothetical protein [Candidatus Woesearchaeota archaeon]|tara:strand:+ start:13255 stop:15003 length:1749 start_codon:yes stop_codon:yes gene_type:complete
MSEEKNDTPRFGWPEFGFGLFAGAAISLSAVYGPEIKHFAKQKLENTVENIVEIKDDLSSKASELKKKTSDLIQDAKNSHANSGGNLDLSRGGTIDEIFKHPELGDMGSSDYERDGKHIFVEKYYDINMFANPGKVFSIDEKIRQSPFEYRLLTEERLRERKINQREEIINFIGNISNITGKIMKKEGNYDSIHAANNNTSDRDFYRAVSKALRIANVVYKEEESVESAFSPSLHHRNHIHLDCNMLCDLIVGVAQNYGRESNQEIGNNHLYISSNGFEFEATAFRKKNERVETRQGVKWRIIEHSDSPSESFLIKEIGFHANQDFQNDPYASNNIEVAKHRGKYTKLSQRSIEEVIEGNLRAHFIRELDDNDEEKIVAKVKDYISFAKDVKNKWVAIQGFNMLSNMGIILIEDFASNKILDKSHLNEKIEYIIKGMESFSKNHEVLREIGKKNLETFNLYNTYMNDTTLENALSTLNPNDYNGEGKRQIRVYSGILKDTIKDPEKAVDSIYNNRHQLSSQVTVNLFSQLIDYVKREEQELIQGYKDALKTKTQELYNVKPKDNLIEGKIIDLMSLYKKLAN